MDTSITIPIVCTAITGLFALIAMIYMKRNIENTAFELKDDVLDYLHTEEGMTEVAFIGKLFGAGAMSVVKQGMGIDKPMKITGNKGIDTVLTQIAKDAIPSVVGGVLKKLKGGVE